MSESHFNKTPIPDPSCNSGFYPYCYTYLFKKLAVMECVKSHTHCVLDQEYFSSTYPKPTREIEISEREILQVLTLGSGQYQKHTSNPP